MDKENLKGDTVRKDSNQSLEKEKQVDYNVRPWEVILNGDIEDKFRI